jgi:hypothetical protein
LSYIQLIQSRILEKRDSDWLTWRDDYKRLNDEPVVKTCEIPLGIRGASLQVSQSLSLFLEKRDSDWLTWRDAPRIPSGISHVFTTGSSLRLITT